MLYVLLFGEIHSDMKQTKTVSPHHEGTTDAEIFYYNQTHSDADVLSAAVWCMFFLPENWIQVRGAVHTPGLPELVA